MPVRVGLPITTHQWLKPLYAYLNKTLVSTVASGASGIISGVAIGASGLGTVQIGGPTSIIGFYGSSGLAGQLATGGNVTGMGASYATSSGLAATGIAGSGLIGAMSQFGFNGGTGNMYTINDMVLILKNAGLAKP